MPQQWRLIERRGYTRRHNRMRARSSADRALASGARGQRFESSRAYQRKRHKYAKERRISSGPAFAVSRQCCHFAAMRTRTATRHRRAGHPQVAIMAPARGVWHDARPRSARRAHWPTEPSGADSCPVRREPTPGSPRCPRRPRPLPAGRCSTRPTKHRLPRQREVGRQVPWLAVLTHRRISGSCCLCRGGEVAEVGLPALDPGEGPPLATGIRGRRHAGIAGAIRPRFLSLRHLPNPSTPFVDTFARATYDRTDPERRERRWKGSPPPGRHHRAPWPFRGARPWPDPASNPRPNGSGASRPARPTRRANDVPAGRPSAAPRSWSGSAIACASGVSGVALQRRPRHRERGQPVPRGDRQLGPARRTSRLWRCGRWLCRRCGGYVRGVGWQCRGSCSHAQATPESGRPR